MFSFFKKKSPAADAAPATPALPAAETDKKTAPAPAPVAPAVAAPAPAAEPAKTGWLRNPFGMGGATVEVDETCLGNDPDAETPKPGKSRGIRQMMKFVSLVERGRSAL